MARARAVRQVADTSHRQDTSSGLYDFPLREYSVQGRWPSPDPIGLASVCFKDPQTQNRYAYVRNNPLSFLDPTGGVLEDGDRRGGCNQFVNPLCGFCNPFFDPFCGIGPGGGDGGGFGGGGSLALIPPGIFRALQGGGDEEDCCPLRLEDCLEQARAVNQQCIGNADEFFHTCEIQCATLCYLFRRTPTLYLKCVHGCELTICTPIYLARRAGCFVELAGRIQICKVEFQVCEAMWPISCIGGP